MDRRLREGHFRDLNLEDTFFNSLRADYDFDEWFRRKADEPVLLISDGEELSGLVYLKVEVGAVDDVDPPLPSSKWLKVGTLKIVARGTRLGERVLKRIFDEAIETAADGIYVTMFGSHQALIQLFERYGFAVWGTKGTGERQEVVLVRQLAEREADMVSNYPFVTLSNNRAWLLAVYPEYHTRLFPDSILRNESSELIQDIPSANTIHKVYVGGRQLSRMNRGDAVVLYRTSDGLGPARFRSVATSICVVEEVRPASSFPTKEAFVEFCRPHSVFDATALGTQYGASPHLCAVKMTYNASFKKRPTRGDLIDIVGISEQPRWDLRQLTHEEFRAVARLGGVDARIVVD